MRFPKTSTRAAGFAWGALLLATALLCGCGKDLTPPNTGGAVVADPAIRPTLRASVGDRAVTLSWTVENTANITEYRVYRSLQDSSGYTLVRSVNVLTYSDADVQNGTAYFYQVSSVLSDGRVSEPSATVSADPGLFAVSINGGVRSTRTQQVTLQLSAPGGTASMLISEDPSFTGTAWQPFTAQLSFTLQAGDGPHTVWARFRDFQGNDSQPTSDAILLDTQAYIDSTEYSPVGGSLSPGSTLHLRVRTRGPEAGGTASVDLGQRLTLQLNDQGQSGDTHAGDGIYELDYTVPRGVDVLRASVVAHFTDAAGNQAPDVPADSLLTIHTPPTAVTLLSVKASGDPTSISLLLAWSPNADPGFAGYQVMRADAPSGTPAASAFGQLTLQTGRDNTSYTDASVLEGARYAYRIDVVDSLGFTTSSAPVIATARVVDGVTLQAPQPGVGADSLNVILNWTQTTDASFGSYQVMRAQGADTLTVPADNAYSSIDVESGRSTLTYADVAPQDNTAFWYRVDEISSAGTRHKSNARAILTRNAPPAAVTLAQPFEAVDGQVSLSWSRSNARDFASYRVYRAQGSGADTTLATLVMRTASINTLTVIDSVGVKDNTTYYYRVFTTDQRGLATASAEQSYLTHNQPPPAQDITGVSTSGPGVSLSWAQSTVSDFDSYRIYRSRGVDVSNGSTLVGTISDRNSSSFLDAFGQHGVADTLRPNTDYYYRVYVYDKGGLFAGGAARLVHSPNYSLAPRPPVAVRPRSVSLSPPRRNR